VDAIAGLIEDKGEAQAADIALRLKAATTSVVKTLARLEDLGLLTQESRGSVALTGEGWKLADDARRKRRMVEAFLLALGVSEGTARSDSDVMAAQASEETLRAMARFLARKLG
jgi:DtxR family manganese transport transcriptional regulator